MVYLGLPIKNGDFPWQTVSHNQRVTSVFFFLRMKILGHIRNQIQSTKDMAEAALQPAPICRTVTEHKTQNTYDTHAVKSSRTYRQGQCSIPSQRKKNPRARNPKPQCMKRRTNHLTAL